MENRPTRNSTRRFTGLILVALIPALMLLLPLIPMSSNKVVNLPFLQERPTGKILVFGGFPSCSSVCPIQLSTLQQTYINYRNHSSANDLQVLFLNIELDTPDTITRAYAKSFHQDFDGYSIKTRDALQLRKTLALQTFASGETIPNHNGYIYLFASEGSQWKMERIFNNNTNQQQLLRHLLNTTT